MPTSIYDANTILKADENDTPVALVVPASTIIGRTATGGIAALTATEAQTILGPGIASYSAGSGVDLVVNPMPAAVTNVNSMSITIPASATARTAFISVAISHGSGQPRRFGVYLDGVGHFPGGGLPSWAGEASTWLWSVSLPISIPGDNVPHTIDLRASAFNDTNSTTFKRRSIGALVV